jgi:hypothetical protein
MDDVLTLSSSQSKPYIPQTGLFAWYDTAYTSSYPSTGTTWYDISGNGLNMSPISASSFPTYDAANSEFDFNGTNTAIASTVFTTSSLTNMTQVAWVKIASNKLSSDAGVYCGTQNVIGGGASGKWDGMGYYNQGTGWTLASDSAVRPVSSNYTESISNYVLIVGTRTSGNFRIYRNGNNLIASASFEPNAYGTGRVYVGSTFLNGSAGNWGTGWFSGSLSMYAVYNRVLTGAEIDSIYNIGRL